MIRLNYLFEFLKSTIKPRRKSWIRISADTEARYLYFINLLLATLLGAILVSSFYWFKIYTAYRHERIRYEGPGYTIIIRDDYRGVMPNEPKTEEL